MLINYITWIVEHAQRADQSSVGAINRPLQMSSLFINLHHRAPTCVQLNGELLTKHL
jgi:hypothetical protein